MEVVTKMSQLDDVLQEHLKPSEIVNYAGSIINLDYAAEGRSLAMKRMILLILVMVVAVGCAPRKPKPVTFDFATTNTYDATFDKTWEAVISIFAETNVPIQTLEKDSGLVVSGDLASNTTYYHCKSSGWGYSVKNPTGRFNVFVRKISDGKTSVQINSTYKAQEWIGDTLMRWLDCKSTGKLEGILFAQLRTRLSPP